MSFQFSQGTVIEMRTRLIRRSPLTILTGAPPPDDPPAPPAEPSVPAPTPGPPPAVPAATPGSGFGIKLVARSGRSSHAESVTSQRSAVTVGLLNRIVSNFFF